MFLLEMHVGLNPKMSDIMDGLKFLMLILLVLTF